MLMATGFPQPDPAIQQIARALIKEFNQTNPVCRLFALRLGVPPMCSLRITIMIKQPPSQMA